MPQKTSDIPLELPGLYLFVGPADGGKSYASTSFGLKSKEYGGDDPRPAYMLELDGRVAALRGRPIVFDSFTSEDGAVAVLNRLDDLGDICIKNKRAPFHTLIVASFTAFNDMAIGDSLQVKADEGKEGRKRGELTLMTIEDYGYEAEAVRKLLWERLDVLKKYCTVIVEAHETEYYKAEKTKPGEPTKSVLAGYKILARDKIAARIPTKFDEIYHFHHKEVAVATKQVIRKVTFQDMLARTSYPALQKITTPIDIQGKEFYLEWKRLIAG